MRVKLHFLAFFLIYIKQMASLSIFCPILVIFCPSIKARMDNLLPNEDYASL